MQMNFKPLALILFLFGSLQLQAQWQYFGSDTLDTNQVGMIHLYGQGNINSNTLVNDFIYGFTDGRYIEPSTIENMLDRSPSLARLGSDVDFGIEYKWRTSDSTNNNQWIRFADRQHYHMLLDDEYLAVLLTGNGDFRGQELSAENNAGYGIRYQQFQYGRSFGTNRFSHQVGFSILNAEYLQLIELENSTFFTADNGDYIVAMVDGSYVQSDTAKRNLLSHNGLGASIDYRFQVDLDTGLQLNVDILDLGATWWYNQSIHTPLDTTFTYDGVYVGNYLTALDNGSPQLPFDSLRDDIVSGSYKKALWRPTPMTTNVSVSKEIGEQQHRLGAIMKFWSGYSPQVYYSYTRRMNQWIMGGSLRYGGYGKLSAGLQVGAEVENFTILLSTNSFESVFNSATSGATSFNFSARYTLPTKL